MSTIEETLKAWEREQAVASMMAPFHYRRDFREFLMRYPNVYVPTSLNRWARCDEHEFCAEINMASEGRQAEYLEKAWFRKFPDREEEEACNAEGFRYWGGFTARPRVDDEEFQLEVAFVKLQEKRSGN